MPRASNVSSTMRRFSSTDLRRLFSCLALSIAGCSDVSTYPRGHLLMCLQRAASFNLLSLRPDSLDQSLTDGPPGGFIRVDLPLVLCDWAQCEISGHCKAMAPKHSAQRRRRKQRRHIPPIPAAHGPAVAAGFPVVQRVLQLNVSLGRRFSVLLHLLPLLVTCSVTFGSFVLMS